MRHECALEKNTNKKSITIMVLSFFCVVGLCVGVGVGVFVYCRTFTTYIAYRGMPICCDESTVMLNAHIITAEIRFG